MPMDFEFEESQAVFKSGAQKARVWTEDWVLREMYCPACGQKNLNDFPNNQPVADFYCGQCDEQYELKATKSKFGRKVNDGAYETMMARLRSNAVPSLMMLRYDLDRFGVEDISVVPRQFFTPNLIEKRKPLAKTARRAGWVGCNILIHKLPVIGKIEIVKSRQIVPVEEVVSKWQKTQFLKTRSLDAKGWLLDVLNCIHELKQREFSLADVYRFENYLSELHPDNNHIRPKIRQQLQVLRDAGILEFVRRGEYRLIS